jgi:transcriptional regulator GlxA family with amidase domain
MIEAHHHRTKVLLSPVCFSHYRWLIDQIFIGCHGSGRGERDMGSMPHRHYIPSDMTPDGVDDERRRRMKRGKFARDEVPAMPISASRLFEPESGGLVIFDIVLWPGFDIHDLSALLDVFHLANNTVRHVLFTWRVWGLGGQSVEASCGLLVQADRSFDHLSGSSNLLILAGLDAPAGDIHGFGSWLRRQIDGDARIGLIGGAATLLAEAGLLDGRSCVAHWAHIDVYRQRHQQVNFRDQIYHVDHRILTCSGGCGTTDLALACVRDLCGAETALLVADRLNRCLVRDEHDLQRTDTPATGSLTRGAAQIMRQHIEAPLDLREIAGRLGTSLRRLQRSFKRYEKLTPTQFYVRERLLYARRLLRQDPSLSIAGVATHCGFVSASDFARNFTRQFGYPPSRMSC